MNTINEIEKRNLGIATTYIKPLTDKFFVKFYHFVFNIWMFVMQKIDPHAPGFCIFSKKEVFDKIKFDETIKLAEDHAFMRKAFKQGYKYGIIKNSRILVSVRRFGTEGNLKLIIKYVLAMLHRIFLGEIRTDIFKYGFKHK